MNTNEKIFQAFNPKCNEVKEDNEYKPKLRIQSSVHPPEEERQFHPKISAINNSDRRQWFNNFNEDLLNRILDIKNNKL